MIRFRSGCPIASALDLVGDRWTFLILRAMALGATSYSDFLRQPEKIATNILGSRLEQMVEAGLIAQVRPRQGSMRGAYALTVKGADLLPVLQAMARWGEAHIPDRWTPPERFYALTPEELRPSRPDGSPIAAA